MMLELSEIWNFHRHCGKVLLVCFNTGNISISWPVRMAAVGEAVDLCLQSLGRSTDKGTLTAVNFVWTLSIQLTHHRLFSLITGGNPPWSVQSRETHGICLIKQQHSSGTKLSPGFHKTETSQRGHFTASQGKNFSLGAEDSTVRYTLNWY